MCISHLPQENPSIRNLFDNMLIFHWNEIIHLILKQMITSMQIFNKWKSCNSVQCLSFLNKKKINLGNIQYNRSYQNKIWIYDAFNNIFDRLSPWPYPRLMFVFILITLNDSANIKNVQHTDRWRSYNYHVNQCQSWGHNTNSHIIKFNILCNDMQKCHCLE